MMSGVVKQCPGGRCAVSFHGDEMGRGRLSPEAVCRQFPLLGRILTPDGPSVLLGAAVSMVSPQFCN